ncbi:MAG: MFS transporter [Aeromicrobium sp.]|uniref:MFS transporter n=1 Tax=Aeromicrobium sp. TaxID=1871063 RepID=UPI0025C6B171|nr:MFS transporter [Aeromicrobium sp.]MCK5891859.1 MFS transporter [Aeromicrobium sp.]MDF1703897.1 MFS transporter [Aeromicrobium sp.]
MSATISARRVFSPSAVIAVLCLGSLSGALMQSLVIPIQSELPQLLNTDASSSSWAITATLLAAAVTMPVSGRLADMYGKKRVLVASAAVLAVGSLVAAMSSTLAPFLVGRALQGVAMGYIPVAISLVREIAPKDRANSAVAMVSATLGVGGALGLPLSAWIADRYSWHGLFWLSTVLALVVLALTVVVVPHVSDGHPAHLDVVGIVGLAVGLSAALIGVSKGSTWGWGDPETVGSILGGVLVLLAWGAYELRHGDPLVDLRISARRPVLFTNLAAVLIGFGMMAQSIVMPQLLQLPEATGFGLGQTILQAGLWMAPAGFMMMLFAPVSSGLLTAIGARVTLSIGAVVVSLGYVASLLLMGSPWQLMIGAMIGAAGVGIGYAAMPTLILDNVPAHEAGSGVGVNALMRSVGTTIAGAVMAAILTSRTIELAPGATVPSEGAFQLCFVVGAGAALAGALVALLVPRLRRPDPAAQQPAGDDADVAQTVPVGG